MPETVLIVDDEEPVRRTFREWLEQSDLDVEVRTAADAEAALVLANQHTVDLAILDWNLGAGNDGLQLLEDLTVFNPDVVAIMVTGFAHQATPLDAMRMGVRDYFDKNQDLNRATFLAAVRRQLDRIRPAKRERGLHQSLVAFREAVEKVLPLVQAAAALNDPVPLPAAIHTLFRFVLRGIGAADGVLLVRSYDPGREPAEVCRVYDAEGRQLAVDLVPFARSVAGSVASLQEPAVMEQPDQAAAAGAVELQPFERGRRSLLAAPLPVASGLQAVLELFDKQGADGFSAEDQRRVATAAEFGTELLRQALAQRQTHQLLFDAVAAALRASDSVRETLRGTPAERRQEPPPAAVLDELRRGLGEAPGTGLDPADTVRLAEAVRVLALRYGTPALQHCVRLIEDLRRLLDEVTGAEP
jgi:ActR/RegA family two-component response regulator